ncbi:MAG: phytoene/squalene synthase family protein [Puniceicoccaceae bacterium]
MPSPRNERPGRAGADAPRTRSPRARPAAPETYLRLPESLLERIPALPADGAPAPAAPPADLSASFGFCRESTRIHAKTFYFASRFLPRAKRREAYAVYSYCRYIDDRIDEAEKESAIPDEAALREENRRLLSGGHPAPFAGAFAWVCRERGIPGRLLDDLVSGCCRDRGRVRIATHTELLEYCYLVASVAGLMMCRIFGVTDARAYPRAVRMGLAMQLTNILRDVAEDFAKDRIYLPAEDLEARGLDVRRLLAEGPTPQWRDYLAALTAEARDWYRSAAGGLPFLSGRRTAWTAGIMGRVYAGILDEIETAGYDVRRRHHVPLRRKVVLAFRRSGG